MDTSALLDSSKDWEHCIRVELSMGRPFAAYDLANKALTLAPEHSTFLYLAGLALANCGSLDEAQDLVERCLLAPTDDKNKIIEVLCLAGRIAKERFHIASITEESRRSLERAFDFYSRAFELSRDYFPAINIASIAMLMGDMQRARDVAFLVEQLCLQQLEHAGADTYWLKASIGESALICERADRAKDWYRQAKESCGGNIGALASMVRQLDLMTPCRPEAAAIMKMIRPGPVLACVGHMIDRPDRPTPRFPAILEPEVSRQISACLDELMPSAIYCSSACGADIIFAEQAIARGVEVNVLLPFEREEFVAISVAFAGEQWINRFHAVLSRATQVIYSTEDAFLGDNDLFLYCNRYMLGLCRLRATQIETEAVLVAVRDGNSPAQTGGTAETVKEWFQSGGNVKEIALAEGTTSKSQSTVQQETVPRQSQFNISAPLLDVAHPSPHPDIQPDPRKIWSILFADVVGYSQFREKHMSMFFHQALKKISSLFNREDTKPSIANTWGDGIFLCFDEIDKAADVALQLHELMATTDWKELGVPDHLTLRMGLHAGPAFFGHDPISNRETVYGSHVNRAARLEPIAIPGVVFVTEQFAALLSNSNQRKFKTNFIGTMPLAKEYGNLPIYALRKLP